MSLTPEQYLALSQAAYAEFNASDENSSLSIDPASNNNSTAIRDKLESTEKDLGGELNMAIWSNLPVGWKILAVKPTDSTGFSAVAFQAPVDSNNNPGEVVFAFAGTDLLSPKDIATDFVLAMNNLPGQFNSATTFVNDVLNNHSEIGTNFSFTGHSLGGAVAQYMTYYKKVGQLPNSTADIHAVTFNAPGIGQLDELTAANPSGFNSLITNYINENDYIGGFGIHLGVTKYLKDTTPGYSSMNQAQRKALREYVSIALLISTGGISELVGEKLLLNKGAEFTALIFSEGRETGVNSIAGGAGNDWIEGGDSHDVLFGDAGNDTIHGMAGGDWIDGGDILYFFVGRLSCIKKELMYGL